jgi:hypothetical protein
MGHMVVIYIEIVYQIVLQVLCIMLMSQLKDVFEIVYTLTLVNRIWEHVSLLAIKMNIGI